MTNSPHFGVMVPQIKRTWQETERAASAFEEMGFDSLWVNDHLYGPQSPAIPMLEAWTLAAGIAAVTETRVERKLDRRFWAMQDDLKDWFEGIKR